VKKIPSLWLYDENHNMTKEVNPLCQWVFDGQGVPTQKWDGTCCNVNDGILYKRREVKRGKTPPVGFILEDCDPKADKLFGWIQVDFKNPENKYHEEAFKRLCGQVGTAIMSRNADKTYELIGPKIQGNPEQIDGHFLVEHGSIADHVSIDPLHERTYDYIRQVLSNNDIEGLVYWHPDGRRAKIKQRDFGMERNKTRKKEFSLKGTE